MVIFHSYVNVYQRVNGPSTSGVRCGVHASSSLGFERCRRGSCNAMPTWKKPCLQNELWMRPWPWPSMLIDGYKTDMKDASPGIFHDLSTSACVILIWGYVGYYAGFLMWVNSEVRESGGNGKNLFVCSSGDWQCGLDSPNCHSVAIPDCISSLHLVWSCSIFSLENSIGDFPAMFNSQRVTQIIRACRWLVALTQW